MKKVDIERQKSIWGDYYCIKVKYPKSIEFYGKDFSHFPVGKYKSVYQLDNYFLQYCFKKRGAAENLIKRYMREAENYAKENNIENLEFEFKSMEVISVMETFNIY